MKQQAYTNDGMCSGGPLDGERLNDSRDRVPVFDNPRQAIGDVVAFRNNHPKIGFYAFTGECWSWEGFA